jgi:glyoxylase-like metal-dependent hydrolase (beta-lactamase superfamily II)
VHAADWAHFATDEHRGGFHGRDAIAPLEGTDALSVTTADAEVAPGIRVVHTPGHTPGHRSVLIEDAGERVLLAGDLVHLPVQVAHPSWPSTHDGDPMLGVASRRLMLFRARVGGWVVGVPHFVRPFGRVGSEGWVPDGTAGADDRLRPDGPAR